MICHTWAQTAADPTSLRSAGGAAVRLSRVVVCISMEELARLAGPKRQQGASILAHLGNGASLAAVRHGNP